MTRWLAVGVVGLTVLLLLVYGGWQGKLADRLRDDYEALRAKRSSAETDARRVLDEVAAKDAAIQGLSRKILDLSRAADADRARAAEAEGRAATAEGRVAGHQAEIARLTALAASRARLDGRERATAYLRSAGYPSAPYAMPESRPPGTQRP